MTVLYWIVLGVSCVAGGIVLIGIGYLLGLDVAARRAELVLEEMARDREIRRTMLRQWEGWG